MNRSDYRARSGRPVLSGDAYDLIFVIRDNGPLSSGPLSVGYQSAQILTRVGKQTRGMFYPLINSDLDARANLLRDILAQLRAGGHFDVAAQLHSTWEAVEAMTMHHFALSGRRGGKQAK